MGEGREPSYGPDAYFLGPTQVAWLKRELMASRATWKVIAADMPLSLVVVYDGENETALFLNSRRGKSDVELLSYTTGDLKSFSAHI